MLFRTLSITVALAMAGLIALVIFDLFTYINDAMAVLSDGQPVESTEQPQTVEVLSRVLSWTDRK